MPPRTPLALLPPLLLLSLTTSQLPPNAGPGALPEPPPPFEMRPKDPDFALTRPKALPDAAVSPGWRCFMLNTASTLMAPAGFGGTAPKPFTSLGFHSGTYIETQVRLGSSAALYRPLARVPKNDGCAYQASFGGLPDSGCTITGGPAPELPAGGWDIQPPDPRAPRCQLYSSCVPRAVWEGDERHRGDLGAQGQWCSEIGGCWAPATGLRPPGGCLCYSDRPLSEEYGPNVTAEPRPAALDGALARNCTDNWIRLLGGTRCGFLGYGALDQRPTGPEVRDRGVGRVPNPALQNVLESRRETEFLEQDSDSFVIRRHPDCVVWNETSMEAGSIRGKLSSDPGGACMYEGQVQLAARAISRSGEPSYAVFRTLMNTSMVYTLRIAPEARFSTFDLIAADGHTIMERQRLHHSHCFNHLLGRNLGLSRLPLPGQQTIVQTCTYTTPISACYASDPAQWGSDSWKRTAGDGLKDDAANSRVFQEPAGAKCEPPFCTPHSGGGYFQPQYQEFRFPGGG